MKKAIYVFSSGELHRKQNTLYLEGEAGKKYIPVENTGEIYLFGEVSINKKLLEFLCQSEIILHFFNHYGYYIGSFYPREHYNSGHVILKQAEFYLDPVKRLSLARQFVRGAVDNIRKVLAYYANRDVQVADIQVGIENLAGKIDAQESGDQLMGIEGNIREWYYRAFDRILSDPDFTFEKRTRQPPRNHLNALISFGNSMLYVAVLREIYKTHLDPRIGYLHSTNFRRFSLNLDVAEVFKPIIVDRIIFSLVNKQMLSAKDFEDETGGIFLKEAGRKVFVKEFDERLAATFEHRELNRSVAYRELLRMELYKVEKHLIEDVPYEPFVSRW